MSFDVAPPPGNKINSAFSLGAITNSYSLVTIVFPFGSDFFSLEFLQPRAISKRIILIFFFFFILN